jgi:hypothetical protein
MASDLNTLSLLVRQLIASGHAADLADLMVGDSPFNAEATQSDLTLPAEREKKIAMLYAARMAWEHVTFLAKFGRHATGSIKQDQRVYSAYPEYFEKWIEDGCTGLLLSDVQRYLKAKS